MQCDERIPDLRRCAQALLWCVAGGSSMALVHEELLAEVLLRFWSIKVRQEAAAHPGACGTAAATRRVTEPGGRTGRNWPVLHKVIWKETMDEPESLLISHPNVWGVWAASFSWRSRRQHTWRQKKLLFLLLNNLKSVPNNYSWWRNLPAWIKKVTRNAKLAGYLAQITLSNCSSVGMQKEILARILCKKFSSSKLY